MSRDLSMHEALERLQGLLGSWEGEGRGDYPTISPFAYAEEVVFGHVGKPFLTYRQRTWDLTTGAPLHAEAGYLRATGPDRVEFVLAHPTGIVEVEEGQLADGVLRIATTSVGRSSTAKEVRSLRRELRWTTDQLDYDLWMAHADTPETHHLAATLYRQR
jgi:hypothetical protein